MPNTKQEITKEVKLLKPKNDIVFQCLFNQNNERITKAFMQAILEEKIDKIVINNDKELFREFPEDKLGILDLQLDINNNEKVDVEVQLINKENLQDRLLLYFSKLYSSQIKRGEDYKEAKRIILVAILDYEFELTKDIKTFETIWRLREDENCEKVLTNKIEIHILELKKVRDNYLKNKENVKLQWMLFLDNPNSKEVQEIMKENEEVKEAIVEVHKMSEDEKLQRLADLREKAILDEKACYDAGLHTGIEQGIEQIIKKLIDSNMPKEEISRVTGMPIEEIIRISQSIKKKEN